MPQQNLKKNEDVYSMYQLHFHNPVPIHFIGIGGISMSGLAEILLKESFPVYGSDSHASELTDHLTRLGAQIRIGQKASNIPADCEVVVYTAAIHPDNPEFVAAKERAAYRRRCVCRRSSPCGTAPERLWGRERRYTAKAGPISSDFGPRAR